MSCFWPVYDGHKSSINFQMENVIVKSILTHKYQRPLFLNLWQNSKLFFFIDYYWNTLMFIYNKLKILMPLSDWPYKCKIFKYEIHYRKTMVTDQTMWLLLCLYEHSYQITDKTNCYHSKHLSNTKGHPSQCIPQGQK